jgi:hypothetical protein
MKNRSINPEVIKERIVRTRAELRRLKVELRLAEAEQKDRERLQQSQEAAKHE